MISRSVLSLTLLLIAAPAFPAQPWSDVSLRAQRLDSLGPFLERYVGRCDSAEVRADCEQNVRAARKSLDGKVYTTSVGVQTLEIVRPERTASGYRYVVTPFIDGGGIALTRGEPRKQDSAGRPLIELVVLDGPLPAGMDEFALESAIRTGRIELEVAFRPEGTWRLKRREGGYYEGVKARFVALRLVESRTGAEIASRVFSDAK